MISRRSFLLVTTSTPILTFFSPLSAEEISYAQHSYKANDELVAQIEPAAFGIQEWQENSVKNPSSTRFIRLSASWKSGWL